MSNLENFVNFNPEKDIPSQEGKVIFVTGGTAGLGRASVLALAKHAPAHIYFTGRNTEAAASLIQEIQQINPSVGVTFVKMDMTSLSSVKEACAQFSHDRLDILMCNAGVMFIPPGLSKDGYENHFAINHLAHAMIIKQLLPVMSKTADLPNSDVRLISLTSAAWSGHTRDGIAFSTLKTTQEGFLGWSFRYSQSKLANLLYPMELARRYPKIKSVSVHPGAVKTNLVTSITLTQKIITFIFLLFIGTTMMEEDQGRLSPLWVAAGAKNEELVNGGYYTPVGRLSNDRLDKTAKDQKLAEDLWNFTEDALAQI